MKTEPLIQGNYYHIYNRGNNGCDLFVEDENYLYFLRLYEKYIDPIAETFAWCLMKNHFHFLVYIKTNNETDVGRLTYKTVETPKRIDPSKQFSHLFDAYSQAFNKRYKRTGSLFEKNFERKLVPNERYFKQLIFYIHNNSVHHGIAGDAAEYPWSSYGSIVSSKPTKLERERVISYYGTLDNFILYHRNNVSGQHQDLIIEDY